VLCTVFHLTQNLQILIQKFYTNSLVSYNTITFHLYNGARFYLYNPMHEKNRLCVLRAVKEDYYIDDNHNHYLNVMQYTAVHIPTAVTTLLKKYNLMQTVSLSAWCCQPSHFQVHDCMKFYYISRNEGFAHPQIQVLWVSMKMANYFAFRCIHTATAQRSY
jgi:hypothetical protein